MRQRIAVVVFIAFIFVTVLGLPLLLTHAGHHHDCPLAQGAQLCESTTLEHVAMWEFLLASVLDSLIIVFVVSILLVARTIPSLVKIRYRHSAPLPPTLLQELFSSGILNRKEPYPGAVF